MSDLRLKGGFFEMVIFAPWGIQDIEILQRRIARSKKSLS